MRSTKLFIASKNKGKIEEIKYCLKGIAIEFLSFIERPDVPDVPETGSTFEENAWLKAKAVYDIVKIPVIADDSGIEVDYLMGDPGVYSSRFAGENATDYDNCKRLLEELDDVEDEKRSAQFKCVIVFYDGSSKEVFEGVCNGKVIRAKHGTGGFGYDPLFVPDGYTQTYAELEPEVKNRISHRGLALEKLKDYLNSTERD